MPGQIVAAYHDATCNSHGTADHMNTRTKFDMYLAPPSRASFAALDNWMQAEIADIGKAANLKGNFAVGQVCGITLATAPMRRFHYLATPVMDDDPVPEGYYNSLIITPREGGITALKDFDPAQHRAVINEPGSFSGAITFAAHLRQTAAHTLENPLLSGGHLASVGMIAAGRAQLAAIDRVSFALASAAHPDNVAAVRVIDETAFYPGLPFVADGALSPQTVERLRCRLLAFRTQPAWREMATVLRLRDMTVLNATDYDIMARVGMSAAGG